MKIIAISDTHRLHYKLNLPEADMIIHCGDFSNNEIDCFSFLQWYSDLNYKYKILVAGNHDAFIERKGYENFFNICKEYNIIYLQDTEITIEGIKFYGSPWVNIFGLWSFMDFEKNLEKHFAKISFDTNFLITHGPAYQIGDLVQQDIMEPNVGSFSLKEKIKELKELKVHVFGHIHDDFGHHKQKTYDAYNVSIKNDYVNTINPYTLIEI